MMQEETTGLPSEMPAGKEPLRSERDPQEQANFLDQDCMPVIGAPLVPGEVFGPPAEAALEQSRRTKELT